MYKGKDHRMLLPFYSMNCQMTSSLIVIINAYIGSEAVLPTQRRQSRHINDGYLTEKQLLNHWDSFYSDFCYFSTFFLPITDKDCLFFIICGKYEPLCDRMPFYSF